MLHVRRSLIDEYVTELDGARVHRKRLGDLKTRKSRRSLDMPPRVLEALRQLRVDQRVIRMSSTNWAEHGLVFSTENGRSLDKGNVRRSLKRLCRNAGVGDWTTYELRHSAASLLSAAGVPIEQVADVLGHSGTRMVEQVYRHPTTPTVSAASAPMEMLFSIASR